MPVLVRRDWRGGTGTFKPSATTPKTRRNPASGDPKSPTGHRCVPPMMPRITRRGRALPADDFGPSYGSIVRTFGIMPNCGR